MKITIEYLDETVSIDTPVEIATDVVDRMMKLLCAFGYAERSIIEGMEEVLEVWTPPETLDEVDRD